MLHQEFAKAGPLTPPHSFIYLFENTFLSWECRLCPQQGLTVSPMKPFFSFWGFAASLLLVTQFPTKIITLWLLCHSWEALKTELFTGLVPEARETVSRSLFSHCSTQTWWHKHRIPGYMEEAVAATGPGLGTSNSSLADVNSLDSFVLPPHQLFIYLFIHSVRHILNEFGGLNNAISCNWRNQKVKDFSLKAKYSKIMRGLHGRPSDGHWLPCLLLQSMSKYWCQDSGMSHPLSY